MEKKTLTLEDAQKQGGTQPYAYFVRLSEVTLGPTPTEVDLDQVLEARFFGPEGEIRIYDDGQGLEAVRITDTSTDVTIDRTTALLTGFGKQLTKRQYIAFDSDGQGYIASTRLLDWEG